jgi:probable F420-dependent oxidoreductase
VDFGLVLPTHRAGASVEGIEAAAEAAERLGFSTVWTTDHLLVERASADEYGRIFEAIVTLAHVGARHPRVRLGVSVVVVPQRQATVLAKELATLDVLSRGRVVAGVGVGWNVREFANIGAGDRFHSRGAYLDETIALWRHLWSGSGEPFEGRFHRLTDYVFEPLPARPGGPPIIVGGRSAAAYRRAGRLGDGYHFSVAPPAAVAERLPVVRAAADAAGRPMPDVSGRVRVRFDDLPPAPSEPFALTGSPDQIAAGIGEFAAIGVAHVAVVVGATDPQGFVAVAERFAREVIPIVSGARTA